MNFCFIYCGYFWTGIIGVWAYIVEYTHICFLFVSQETLEKVSQSPVSNEGTQPRFGFKFSKESELLGEMVDSRAGKGYQNEPGASYSARN